MRQTILTVLSLSMLTALLSGCGGDMVLVNPKGPVAEGLSWLMMASIYIMLLVVIPTIIMALWFGYKYRAGKGAEYKPDWSHSTTIEVVVWGIPILIIIVLASLTWWGSHKYDPYRPLDYLTDKKPLTIQVIAEQFKWVFIYPEQQIAMVNEVRFPEKTPVNFRITSNFTMNSFFIPQLAGQIYAMAGMQTHLNMYANETGTYRGFSATYSGYGFSQMYFKAHSLTEGDFNTWVQTIKDGNGATVVVDEKDGAPVYAIQETMLDKATFKKLRDGNRSQLQIDAMVKNAESGSETQKKLAKIAQEEGAYPTKPHPVTYYSSVDLDIFPSVINCYMSNYHNEGEASKEAAKDSICANVANVTVGE